MATEESALVVLVPECEGLVGAWRARFDPAATYGVAAHVTVLYPFVAPSTIDDALVSDLRALFATTPPFGFTLDAVRRFADQVLYLAPSPPEPFEHLTRTVAEAFPDCPPYGGQHEKVIPHLSVADGAAPELLDDIEAALGVGLPIPAFARRVSLLVGRDEPGTWCVLDDFLLGT
ncbi:MAG: 2'-5' RNA ligase family protein [Acidimicrobiales bacterium]